VSGSLLVAVGCRSVNPALDRYFAGCSSLSPTAGSLGDLAIWHVARTARVHTPLRSIAMLPVRNKSHGLRPLT